MTNYDRMIQNMTVEKLAVLMSENYLDNPCQYCMDLHHECGRCSEGIEEWLKQEAKDDE